MRLKMAARSGLRIVLSSLISYSQVYVRTPSPVSAAVLFLEPEVLLVLGRGAPLLVEDLRRPLLFGVELLARSALVAAHVPSVAPGAGVAHLEVLPGDIHPDEVAGRAVLLELLVDGVRGLARGLQIGRAHV